MTAGSKTSAADLKFLTPNAANSFQELQINEVKRIRGQVDSKNYPELVARTMPTFF
jgi:hypothetical protein